MSLLIFRDNLFLQDFFQSAVVNSVLTASELNGAITYDSVSTII